jgi:hypothetical protein
VVPGVDDLEILQPRRLYARQGRVDEYRRLVEQLRQDRRAYLLRWEGLDPAIVAAAG